MNIGTPGDKSGVFDQPSMQRNVGVDTVDDDLIEGGGHACQRRETVTAVGDQLANHGIVVGGHFVAGVHMRV